MPSAVYKRILLKISGEALGGAVDGGMDDQRLTAYCQEIIAVREMGVDVGIVIGGGNILRGASVSDRKSVV